MHARIQDFFRGGGGADPTARKQSRQRLFLYVLNLFYSLQRGSNGFITEKTILFHGSRGGPTFSRGFNSFKGVVQMFISIETHSPDPLFPPSGSTHDIIPLSLAYFNQSGLVGILHFRVPALIG